MRPTFSIILFTVLSGAGYGLLFLLGLAVALGALPMRALLPPVEVARFSAEAPLIGTPGIALAVALVVGAALASAGLLSSLAHLGKPLRAWRALSQWRSSWLSREGVASLVTFVPLLVFFWFCISIQNDTAPNVPMRIASVLLCACALITVACTANIYASLKTIRAWSNRLVPIGYQYLALYSGALWLTALATVGLPTLNASLPIWLGNALVLAPVSAWLKMRYWRAIDALPLADAGNATGLDRFGRVRSVEAPHTEENYLTHEMGFVLARKHARRLRVIAFVSILLAPLGSLVLALAIGWIAAWIGLVAGLAGVFVERWLFFAQARHVVIAYYAR